MTDEMYERLNDYLNTIFIYLERNDSFLLRNIHSIAYERSILSSLLEDYDIDYYKENIECNVTFQEILLLAREIISKINPNYLEEFDKMLENGMLDFSYEHEYEDSNYTLIMKNNNVNHLININRDFNYSDVIVLIHEFIHYKNSHIKNSINRYLLTEFLSIYFENYAKDYLKEKGINKELIGYDDRIKNMAFMMNEMISYELIILSYEKFGNINERTYEMLNEFFLNIDKENFEKECISILNIFERIEADYKKKTSLKDQSEDELAHILSDPISKHYRYILGTLFAYYARLNCDMNKIIFLNDHINDEDYVNKNLVEVLKTIDIDINDENINKEMIDSVKKYLEEYDIKNKEK